MKKNRNIIISLLFLFGVLLLIFNFIFVHADTGFDTNYDSTTSWDSETSYSGTTDTTSSDGILPPMIPRFNLPSLLMFVIVTICLIIIRIIVYVVSKNTSKIQGNQEFYKTIGEDNIKSVKNDFNKKEFLDNCFKMFVEIEKSYSNFDYDKLKNLLSDELYYMYQEELNKLKNKNRKNILSDFVLIKSDIVGMNVEDNKLSLKVGMVVEFYDYILDKNDKIIKGSSTTKYRYSYDLTFECLLNNNNYVLSSKEIRK